MRPPIEFLYDALHEAVGLIVETNQPEAFRQRLYQARSRAADVDLEGMSFFISPTNPTREVWIIKQRGTHNGT